MSCVEDTYPRDAKPTRLLVSCVEDTYPREPNPWDVDINKELIFEFPIKSVDIFATPLTVSPKVLMEEAVINPELRKTVLRLLKIKELIYPDDPRPTILLVSCVELM